MGKAILYFIIVLLVLVVSFLFTAGLYWVVAWAFDFAFSWKYALGIWVALFVIKSIFQRGA